MESVVYSITSVVWIRGFEPSSDRVLGRCQVTQLGFFRGSAPWAHLGRFELRCGMRHSMVTCHKCGKAMVPRATYSRGFWGHSPSSNHCPFCLSENWHGGNPGLGARLFALVGLALGVLACVLVGALLFKVQWWLGIEVQWPLLSLGTCAVSVVVGYRFYNWFVEC